jgi:hypothetical protein
MNKVRTKADIYKSSVEHALADLYSNPYHYYPHSIYQMQGGMGGMGMGGMGGMGMMNPMMMVSGRFSQCCSFGRALLFRDGELCFCGGNGCDADVRGEMNRRSFGGLRRSRLEDHLDIVVDTI